MKKGLLSLFTLVISLGIFAGMALTTYAEVTIKGEPKIAFLYLSPTNDGGWTQSIERGRAKLDKETGYHSAYTENIPEDSAQVRQAIDLYAKRGYNIIVGTAFGYGDAFLEAAKAYPNIVFLNGAGETEWKNLESFYARTYQGWYLAGMTAGGMSKTGKVGIVAGFPYPVVNWDANAFARGAQAYDPNIKVIVTYVNTWFDPVKEGQAAEAMLEQGADVIATNLSAASVLVAAEQKGKYSVGFQNDMSHIAPEGHLTSVVFQWDAYLISTVKSIAKGKWKSRSVAFLGLDMDMIDISFFNQKIPQEIKDKVMATRKALISGEISPFDGPVYRQDGSLAIPEGRSITDDELWAMNYLVKGVIGKMPAE